jgi:hypothetical protein
LTALQSTDWFNRKDTRECPVFFVVYAHDNIKYGEAYSDMVVKPMIGWLRRIGAHVITDQCPELGEPSLAREGDYASTHDILWNQFCLLPGDGTLSHQETVTSVDKVIVFCSEVLQSYREEEFNLGKTYTREIVTTYQICRDQNENTDAMRAKVRAIQNRYRNESWFHHVLTELAFLEARSWQEGNARSIIPVVLNGNETSYLRCFQGSEEIIRLKVKESATGRVSVQILHLKFFKLLYRLFEATASLVKEFEECYSICLHLPGGDNFVSDVLAHIQNTQRSIIHQNSAAIRSIVDNSQGKLIHCTGKIRRLQTG